MSKLKNINAVIFDWAGTIVDYGCIAPVKVFTEILQRHDIDISMEEARGPMGLAKKDHLRELLKLEKVRMQWVAEYNRLPDESDVEKLYSELEYYLASVIKQYSEPIPGAFELINYLQMQGIKVGSTTGYVEDIMEILIPAAMSYGIILNSVVSSSEVPAGRPFPWMIYKNCERMNVYPTTDMVKIGDTVADILEGKNAGMWTIGVTKSGNEVGLTQEQTREMNPILLQQKADIAAQKLYNAGADYVVDGVWDCWPVLQKIDRRIKENARILCLA